MKTSYKDDLLAMGVATRKFLQKKKPWTCRFVEKRIKDREPYETLYIWEHATIWFIHIDFFLNVLRFVYSKITYKVRAVEWEGCRADKSDICIHTNWYIKTAYGTSFLHVEIRNCAVLWPRLIWSCLFVSFHTQIKVKLLVQNSVIDSWY